MADRRHDLDKQVLKKIEEWKESLIDLSKRNKLLYFKETKSTTLRVGEPGCLEIFSRLIDNESSWNIWEPPPEPKDLQPGQSEPEDHRPIAVRKRKKRELKCDVPYLEKFLRILTNLYRRSQTEYQEKGLYVLNVAFGMLTWKDVETSDLIRSPLVLVPVVLERKSVKGPYLIKPVGEDHVVNPALISSMDKEFKLKLPATIEIPENEAAQALQAFFDSVRGEIKTREKDGWSVDDSVYLSLFSFHKLVMYEDLNSNAETVAKHPLIQALATNEPVVTESGEGEIPEPGELDGLEPSYGTFHILDTDSSQEVCIEAVRRGSNLIMQGPPGTGKSQTIANIIADFIAQGKNVLFISEKMAALQVVHSRLKAKGLHQFCLELHSSKANKREVVQELGRCLEERINPSRSSLSQSKTTDLIRTRDLLNSYVLALREMRKPIELSAQEVMAKLAVLHGHPYLECNLPDVSQVNQKRLEHILELVLQMQAFWDIPQRGRKFPWWGCTFDTFSLRRQKSVPAELNRLQEHIERLFVESGKCAEQLGLVSSKTTGEAGHLIELLEILAESPGCDRCWFAQKRLAEIKNEALQLSERAHKYKQSMERLSAIYRKGLFDLEDSHAAKLQSAWQAAQNLSDAESPGWFEFVKASPSIIEFLDDTDKALKRWEKLAASLSRKGQERPELSLMSCKKLYREVLHRNILRRLLVRISFGAITPTKQMIHAYELKKDLHRWTCKCREFPCAFPSKDGGDGDEYSARFLDIHRRVDEVRQKVNALLQLSNQILGQRLKQDSVELSDVAQDLSALECMKAFEQDLDARSKELGKSFGHRFKGIDTDWGALLSALGWVESLMTLANAKELTPALLDIACKSRATPAAKSLSKATKDTRSSLATVQGWFGKKPQPFGRRELEQVDLQTGRNIARRMIESVDEIERWIDYRKLGDEAEQLKLSHFVDEYLKRKFPALTLSKCLEKALYMDLLDHIFTEDKRLGQFRRMSHDQAVKKFRELDAELVELRCNEIIERANSRRPQQLVDTPGTEEAIVLREAKKKRRHSPVRKLLVDIPTLLPRLKPCLMMSPISVSSYLAPDAVFDLVVFDEASQIPPWDATVAIYRGKQVLLAGDSKQLPPSSFFEKGMLEEGEETEDDSPQDFESILDYSEGRGLRQSMLEWHYRSRHEDLIAFSNDAFYSNRLVTFPASRREDACLGVKFEFVPDGVYDRGKSRTNQVEAQRVAELIFEHLDKWPEKKLGVVAFSQSQKDAIEDRLEFFRKERPEFERVFEGAGDRLQGFFVKNLENVQGDERDVMIFSVGYGKDANGKMTQNFGPLNRDGGERRLNVAITRAREKVILVSSIKKGDVNADTRSAGVRHLRHYLDYAERGTEALLSANDQSQGDFESDFEADVAGEITSMGYRAVPQVGCSSYRIDLGVLDPQAPGRYILGVECDGAMYHSGATARDRDRIRQTVLEGMGWTLHRIWSPTWTKHRKKEIERLREAIERARTEPSCLDGKSSAGHEKACDYDGGCEAVLPEIEKVPVIDIKDIPGTVSYAVAHLDPVDRYHKFGSTESLRHIRIRLATLVAAEGPIHEHVAALRLARLWGASKVGRQMRETFDGIVRGLKWEGALNTWKQFLLPPEMRNFAVRVPVLNVPESLREIDDIAPHELGEAVILALRHFSTIEKQALIDAVARLFGFDRTGARIQKRLGQVVSSLIKGEAVVLRDGRVSLAGHATQKQ